MNLPTRLSLLALAALVSPALSRPASAAFNFDITGSVNVPDGATVLLDDVARQFSFTDSGGSGNEFFEPFTTSPVSPITKSFPALEPDPTKFLSFSLFGLHRTTLPGDPTPTTTTRIFIAANPGSLDSTSLQSIIDAFDATYEPAFTFPELLQSIDDGADIVNGMESPGGNTLFIAFRDYLEGNSAYDVLATTPIQVGTTATLYVFGTDPASLPTAGGAIAYAAIPEPATAALALPALTLLSRRRR